MKLLIFVNVLFLSTITTSAQEIIEVSPPEANAAYFSTPRETLYVHLNKSTYIDGEEIWFKGYAYDRKNSSIARATTNFNVELFDKNSVRVFSGLYLGNEASFKGNIEVDSTWASGDYYLRVSTNWMNNFIEDESYTKKITIINQSEGLPKVNTNTNYDFQLLPEGGHSVADIENVIGYKLMDAAGHGVKFDDGSVFDDQGIKIVSFKSNRLGMGKFNIIPKSDRKYTATIRLPNDDEIQVPFLKIENRGVGIQVSNSYKKNVDIDISTNIATLGSLLDKECYLLVHQNDSSKKIPIKFLPNQTKKRISIERGFLYPGVNILTFFNENIPIVERLVFTPSNKTRNNAFASYVNTVKDSILININIPKKENVTYDISVSVLPEDTKSYNHQDNIKSAMLLKPYLKGFIEDSKYYFNNVNERKFSDLDLLLLTQGWSKYQWNTILNFKENNEYSFDQGLTVEGRLSGNSTIKQAYLFPTKYSDFRLLDLDTNGNFKIDNFCHLKGEFIKVSGVKPNGDYVKTGLYMRTNSNTFNKGFSEIIPQAINQKSVSFSGSRNFLNEEVAQLDEVVIKSKSTKNTLSKGGLSNAIRPNLKQITERERLLYPSVLEYLRIETSGKFIIPTVRTPSSIAENGGLFITSRATNSIQSGLEVAVYLNNVILSDLELLNWLRMDEIESVYISSSGTGGGVHASNGVIRIYSRNDFSDDRVKNDKKKSKVFSIHKMDEGFEPVKEFYNPIYTSFLDPFFKDYGTISWKPSLNFSKEGIATIKVPNTGTKNIKLFIEGMGSDGSLLSKMQILKLD